MAAKVDARLFEVPWVTLSAAESPIGFATRVPKFVATKGVLSWGQAYDLGETVIIYVVSDISGLDKIEAEAEVVRK